jgi:hypothetical protein
MPPQPGAPAPGQFAPPTAPGAPDPNVPQTPAEQARQQKNTSTQNSLLLSELRDSMVIMEDGSFRAVIACKSINFDLMSSREREGVEYSYQNFLNALYFPIQIFIRSQRVDIGPYLDKLSEIRRNQDNMLLNVLMDDYIDYIDALSQEANIMDKSFFVIVPFFPAGEQINVAAQSKGLLTTLFGGGKKNTTITKVDNVTYAKAKEEIKNRVDSVLSGLMQVGVQAVQLNTKQLGELYYNVYNPDTAVREPLGDFSSVTQMYTRRGGAPLGPQQMPPVAEPLPAEPYTAQLSPDQLATIQPPQPPSGGAQ